MELIWSFWILVIFALIRIDACKKSQPKTALAPPKVTLNIPSFYELCGKVPARDYSNDVDKIHVVTGKTIGGKWPFMASIQSLTNHKTNTYSHSCGGTILTRNLILTAAHCLHDKPLHELKIIVGRSDLKASSSLFGLDNTTTERYVTKKFIHPRYKYPKFYFDIALLELDEELEFTNPNNISLICLPKSSNHDVDFRQNFGTTLLGWGFTEYQSVGGYADKIHYAQMNIMSQKSCNDSRRLDNKDKSMSSLLPDLFSSSVFCAGYEARVSSSCDGDSGGPLILYNDQKKSYTQIGVVNGNIQCGMRGHPSIFARLDDYEILKFINNVAFQGKNYDHDGRILCDNSEKHRGVNCDQCKKGYAGWPDCTQCQSGYYKLNHNSTCTKCNCGIGGKGCNNQTGKCICKEGYTGPKCERIKYKLRVMRVKMGANGMNGGVFGITAFGGGEYSFKICQEENNNCCETDQFGTEDNNWEKHEVNYFVGKQLLSCENFVIEAGKKLTIKAQHTGGDGSIIQNITLYGSKYRANTYHTCSIGRKLDHDQSHNSTCLEHPPAYVYEDSCNGDASFCVLPFNEVTFAGAHNAGTGMDENHDAIDCFVKNHDLSVEEMLDFGIRYFDFDVKLCSDNILYTGHGKNNLYIRFGKVKDIMEHIHSWMKEHESEIIVVRFGELLGSRIDGLKELKRILTTTFTTVGINKEFYLTKKWPTMAKAKSSNRRIFVFVDVKQEEDQSHLGNDEGIIGEVKVNKKNHQNVLNISGTTVTMYSVYEKMAIGKNCIALKNAIVDTCTKIEKNTDFIKIGIYTSTSKNIGSCLQTIARQCNSQLENALNGCKTGIRSMINFLSADYPNFPGPSGKTNVEVAFEENIKKLQ